MKNQTLEFRKKTGFCSDWGMCISFYANMKTDSHNKLVPKRFHTVQNSTIMH